MRDQLQLQLAGCVPRLRHAPLSDRIVRVVEHHNPAKPRHYLLEKLEALRREVRSKPAVDACEPSSRLPETLHEPEGDRITTGVEHNRDSLCSLLDRESHRGADGIYQVDFLPFEL